MSQIATLPQSEFRRKYMRRLISELMHARKIDRESARQLAEQMVLFLSDRVFHGSTIDLGFMTIVPKKKKATVVKSHLKTTGRSVFYMGDQVKWSVSLSRAWQTEKKPQWSKYS